MGDLYKRWGKGGCKKFLKESEFLKFGVLFRVKIENSPGKMQNLPIFWG